MKQIPFKKIEAENEVNALLFHIMALSDDKFEMHRKISLSYIYDWASFIGIDNINKILSEFSTDEIKLIYLNDNLYQIYDGEMSVITGKENTKAKLYKPQTNRIYNLFKQLDIPIRYNMDFAVDCTLKNIFGGIK